MASTRKVKSQPTWRDVKVKLDAFERDELTALVGDLYASSSANRTFLHARFSLGDDPLKPYKATISRWLWPDVLERETYSIAKAKAAISDYRKAVGDPIGLVELMTFYCEQASSFCSDVGVDDGGYYDSMVLVFGQALQGLAALEPRARTPFLERLGEVRDRCQEFGYCAGDDAAALWFNSPLTKLAEP